VILGSQKCIHVNRSVNVFTIKKCIGKISLGECSVSVTVMHLLCLSVDIKQLKCPHITITCMLLYLVDYDQSFALPYYSIALHC